MAKHKKNHFGEKEAKRKRLKSSTKKGILAICLFTLAVLAVLSRFDKAGPFGQRFYQAGQFLFGWGFFLIPLIFILAGVALFRSLHKDLFLSVLVGAGLLALSTLAFLQLVVNQGQSTSRSVGGWLGYLFSVPLLKFFGSWASGIILGALILIGWLITFNISLKKLFQKRQLPESGQETGQSRDNLAEQRSQVVQTHLPFNIRTGGQATKPVMASGGLVSRLRHLTARIFPKPDFQVKTIKDSVVRPRATTASQVREEPGQVPKSPTGIKDLIPMTDLLDSETGQPNSGDIRTNMETIQRTLQNFGIEVKMAEVNVGPTVTQYTLKPALGVKLSKITALQSDLSLALAAHPIRVEAPIPGRSLVGIEVPNRGTAMVRLRNLIEHQKFVEAKSFLTFVLGRDVAGEPVFANLARMPHLLIAGATGTGKTICLNALILSLLYKNTPQTLRFILVDPKRVEFSLYNQIPHLLCPVILDAEKTISALRWAVAEMEKRFETLAETGAKDIDSFNKKAAVSRTGLACLPYLIIIIDELADLMAAHGRDVEALIVRLAQMARAVGIHLVVSTQRPSVEVITGLIKANITSRIALQVASQVDSRTILDRAGAEKLLGNGDMLFLSGDAGRSRRIQGAFVTEKEVKRVADYLRRVLQPQYHKDFMARSDVKETAIGGSETADIRNNGDPLLAEARNLVIKARKASASLLQRRLRIGYARAARLLDLLEDAGIVGQQEGSKPREVLLDHSSDFSGGNFSD